MRWVLPAVVVGVLVILSVAATGAGGATSSTPGQPDDLVTAVRAAIAAHDFPRGDALVAAHRRASGVTPEMLAAVSWLARGAAAERRFMAAEGYARQAYDGAKRQLARRPLDQEPTLPVAIGNAVDVLSQVLVEQGARSEAVTLVARELATYRGTSIEKRLQKTLNLLTLEGTIAPPLDLTEAVGATRLPTLASLRGKVVLLFFWAHWCADCKAQAPVLAKLVPEYASRGLVLVAPTQRFGYVAGGAAAAAAEENRYIEEIRRAYYPVLEDVPMPRSEANHRRYGVASTPTLVLLDRSGIVRLYHPGQMSEAELRRALDAQLR